MKSSPAESTGEPLGGGRHDFASWSPSDALRAGEWTLKRLADIGIGDAGENRLRRACDLIRRTNLIPVQFESGSPTAVAVAEALKVTFEQYLIVKHLNELDPLAAKTLRLMLRGPDLPATTGDDQGRDAQAELFTGIIFKAAGYRVDLGEPDLLISSRARKWGVAVKRVKKDRRFPERIRKAQRQLENQRLFGFVVVNPEMLLARWLSSGDSHEVVSKRLFERTNEWVGQIDGSQPGNRVLALMALATAFNARRHGDRFRFTFGVYIHQQYIAGGSPTEIRAVKRIGAAMYSAINSKLGRYAKPPPAQSAPLDINFEVQQ